MEGNKIFMMDDQNIDLSQKINTIINLDKTFFSSRENDDLKSQKRIS